MILTATWTDLPKKKCKIPLGKLVLLSRNSQTGRSKLLNLKMFPTVKGRPPSFGIHLDNRTARQDCSRESSKWRKWLRTLWSLHGLNIKRFPEVRQARLPLCCAVRLERQRLLSR